VNVQPKTTDTPAPAITKRWRYPGSDSFRDDDIDRSVFFGRDAEVQEVLNRLLASSVLVLYAKSGLGKTSLLQAGLFPLLRERNLLPIRLRFIRRDTNLMDELRSAAATTCKEQGIAFTPGEGTTLWEWLNTVLFSKGDQFLTPVLVLDQFEEVFTLQTQAYRLALAQELGSVVSGQPPEAVRERLRREKTEGSVKSTHLASPPNVRLVLSLREEYVGTLQELAQALPGILGQRFRLGPLLREHAQAAIEKPAALPDAEGRFQTRPFRYQLSTIDDLFKKLEGKHGDIEPFQLQLLCNHVERQVAHKQEATPQEDIRVDTLSYFGGDAGMARVLQKFYWDALSKLPGWWQRRKARALRARLAKPRWVSREPR
jgi:hypothetical protein